MITNYWPEFTMYNIILYKCGVYYNIVDNVKGVKIMFNIDSSVVIFKLNLNYTVWTNYPLKIIRLRMIKKKL